MQFVGSAKEQRLVKDQLYRQAVSLFGANKSTWTIYVGRDRVRCAIALPSKQELLDCTAVTHVRTMGGYHHLKAYIRVIGTVCPGSTRTGTRYQICEPVELCIPVTPDTNPIKTITASILIATTSILLLVQISQDSAESKTLHNTIDTISEEQREQQQELLTPPKAAPTKQIEPPHSQLVQEERQ